MAEARSRGTLVVAVVAGLLGGLHLIGGVVAVRGTALAPATSVLVLARAVLGGLLLPTAVGLVRGDPWSRWLGAVAFGGIALLQVLPLVAGATLAVPLPGILASGICALSLLLAPGGFEDGDDGRPIGEDTDPHDFVR